MPLQWNSDQSITNEAIRRTDIMLLVMDMLYVHHIVGFSTITLMSVVRHSAGKQKSEISYTIAASRTS